MDFEELCLNLAYSETEETVIKLLEKQGWWEAPELWYNYGHTENNFATIGNQQSKPESALVEKLINSVDAMLMAECLRRRIEPESQWAPQSISDALETYFDIYDGNLSNANPIQRSRLAENICLVSTGSKTNPCYSTIDKGEGQTPSKMPKTLLSIGESNKLRIPFVQGKFNMGGTGVLQFCGKYNLQLIISRRHPEIAKFEDDESKHKWGFTIVRREDPASGVRNSTYRYLAPYGEILSFEGDGLPLLPGKYPQAYIEKLNWGTFIKLYEYQMPGRLKSNILFDLYNRLSLLMPKVALPVRLFERRAGYSGHTLETTLSGLTVRLDEDPRGNLEQGFPASSTLSAQGQSMKASIFAFKKDQSKKYTNGEGIIFTVNGQTHGYLSKIFFSRGSVGMQYLADSLLVIVDCSDFEGRAREDLFMNSRDRLRAGELRSEIERNLEELLRNNPGLRQLRERRRREQIESKLEDSRPLADILRDILKKSPTLSRLFVDGIRLQNPFRVEGGKAAEVYEGKEFPTYFTLIDKRSIENPRNCPLNARFRVQYKTDARNDYFSRDKDPGEFSLLVNGEEVQDRALNLWNGTANLNIGLPVEAYIGSILHFESSVSDISRVEPFEDEFYVRVQEPMSKRLGQSGVRRPPSSDEKGKDTEKRSRLELPRVIEVRRGEWDAHSFNDESALRVVDSGEHGYDFYVNMDNIHLLTEQKVSSSLDSRLLDAKYKYGMVLIGIALLREYEREKDSEASTADEEDISSRVLDLTKAISPVLLPMIGSLGDLKIEEISVHEEY